MGLRIPSQGFSQHFPYEFVVVLATQVGQGASRIRQFFEQEGSRGLPVGMRGRLGSGAFLRQGAGAACSRLRGVHVLVSF